MINENGLFEQLTESEALEIALNEFLIPAGLTVDAGAVEQQIQSAMAQFLLERDNQLYKANLQYLAPQGTDLDLQNPNIPREDAQSASGYLRLQNDTGSSIDVTINSIFTVAGNEYSTNSNNVTVPASGGVAFISVTSVLTGAAQNVTANSSFSSDYDLTATNPQPFVDGKDAETDTEYKTRLIQRKTDLASYHATNTAIEELRGFYEDAEIFVNSDSNDVSTPIPIPAIGYTTVVLTPSGVQAGAEELENAFQVLANRLEFGNSIQNGNSLHPVLSGVIYTGNFPALYYLIPAQAVEFNLTATLGVSFDTKTSEQEKLDLALSFGQFFAQNIVNFFGGAQGSANVTFNPQDPYESPTMTTVDIDAASGTLKKIAPAFSLELIRSLIQEASNLQSVNLIRYEECSALDVTLDPGVAYESPFSMIINDAYTPDSIDFAQDALFSDNSSWFDRYVFIDPSLITITINEVAY